MKRNCPQSLLGMGLLALGLMFTALVADLPADEISGEVLHQYQKIYVRERAKELDKLLAQMSQSSGTHLADRNFVSLTMSSPSGDKVLLCLSRESPQPMDSWLFIVLEPKTMKVSMIFDFIKAFGIQRIKWLDDNRILVLARSHNLSGPPGKLFHMNLRTGRADLLDDFVWRFKVANSGDDVVYERSDDPREPYGLRNLFYLQISTRDRRRMEQVRHPTKQFGEIGPFVAEGSFFKYQIHTYSPDSFEPKVEKLCFDLMTGKSFKDTMNAVPDELKTSPKIELKKKTEGHPKKTEGHPKKKDVHPKGEKK